MTNHKQLSIADFQAIDNGTYVCDDCKEKEELRCTCTKVDSWWNQIHDGESCKHCNKIIKYSTHEHAIEIEGNHHGSSNWNDHHPGIH